MVHAELVGDGRTEDAGVPGPHTFGVRAQRRRGGHQVGEPGHLRVRRDRPPAVEGVLAQGVEDALAAGALPHRGDQLRLPVLVPVEHQRLLAAEVLEHRGGRHVGRVGNVTDAHLVVAALQKELQCGVGDRLPGGRLLAFATADGGTVMA